MKKFILSLVIVVSILFFTRKKEIYYIPFDIPGKQMATTLPPFGIFIESDFKNNKELLGHEMVHLDQYNKMGFFGYYSTYIKEFVEYGRINGPMEVEARKLNKFK